MSLSQLTKETVRAKHAALLVLAAAVAAATAHAQRPDSDRNRSENAALYFTGLMLPTYARICEARFPGYWGRYEPAFARWQQDNQAQLRDGEQTTLEYLPRLGETLESAKSKATVLAKRLETGAVEAAEQQCRSWARLLSMDMP